MKKIVLTLCLALVAFSLQAQEFKKHIPGVRAGVNFSNISIDETALGISPKSLTGFHIGITDQMLLTRSMPLYLEAGLYYIQKGCKVSGRMFGEDGSITIRPSYLEIPLLATYHFNLKGGFSIQPFIGAYFAYGIGGKAKVSAGDYSSQADLFKASDYADSEGEVWHNDQIMKRSDIGLRMGAAATYGKIYFGLGYELGLTEDIKNESFGVEHSKNRSFTLSLGYNF